MYVDRIQKPKGEYLIVREKVMTDKGYRPRTVKKLGYVEALRDQYDDPVSFFREFYKKETERLKQERDDNGMMSVTLNLGETLTPDTSLTRNVGYAVIKKIYKKLKLDTFWKRHTAGRKMEFDVEKIFYLLVISRLLDPGSKKYSFDKKDQFFEPINGFELEDVYKALDVIAECDEDLQAWLFHRSKELINRNTDICYYDGTNFYFDIGRPDVDDLDDQGNIIKKKYRKRGPEKNKRPDPIINMGLLIDKNAVPISYKIYPGNESEKVHMLPVINSARKHMMIGRIINVADRGLNTSENIWHLAGDNKSDDPASMDGYVFGKSIKGADAEFKEWALDREHFKTEYLDPDPEYTKDEDKGTGDNKDKVKFEYKIRNHPAKLTIHVEMPDGTIKKKVTKTDQRQMAYYSEKYARKQKRDRDVMIERAKDLISHPKKYDKFTAAGSGAYIKNIKFNAETGEVIGNKLELDIEKILEEEKYDGYYSIVTSELNLSAKEIRNIYRGLIRIEHTFRITKSELEFRPIYLWDPPHIKAHFTICFTALYILKILMKILNDEYTSEKILNSLTQCTVSDIGNNLWQFNYYDSCLAALSDKLELTLNYRYRTREQIRRILQY